MRIRIIFTSFVFIETSFHLSFDHFDETRLEKVYRKSTTHQSEEEGIRSPAGRDQLVYAMGNGLGGIKTAPGKQPQYPHLKHLEPDPARTFLQYGQYADSAA